MTREIKFRGRSTHSDDWCYGSFVNNPDEPTICGFDIWADGDSDWREEKVEPHTVGQFTGLHDKNGNEIYEGDILRKSTFFEDDSAGTYLDRNTIGVVRMLPSCGTTICNCIVFETDDPYKEKKMKERIKRAQVVGKRCEIIGNIYDNPELLKGDEK